MKHILRLALIIITVTIFINFLFISGMGVYKTWHGFYEFSQAGVESKPGLEIVESLDLFLVAIVFLILSLSMMKLFFSDVPLFKGIELPWLKVESFYELKHLVWNAFLLTLLITFGTQVLRGTGSLSWELLIIPVSVSLFSLSLKLLKG